MSGIALSRRFYTQAVRPLLGGRPHAAALLGAGSEVLGFDDDVSTDHDFGPRVQVFLPAGVAPPSLAGLPATFEGHPTVFAAADRDGGPCHQVEVTTPGAFFARRLGVDPAAGMGLADWLLTPTQTLATLTAGAVFHDPAGELARRRAALRWYPGDVWRYALAAGWLRVAQEEAFVGRAGGAGDDLGSRLVAVRLVRELVRLAFLVERRWAPYPKWLGSGFARLDLAATAGPALAAAAAAADWRDREDALVTAAGVLIAATNELGLAAPVDPAPRAFHGRDIRVPGAERLTVALTAAITDPPVVALVEGFGGRRGGPVPTVPGTIDQLTDSTEILGDAGRRRRAAALLGLPPG
ncbi:DUF4037 domain-containing protein [Actinoplanes nipponensis]|uniref:DUF4037 domain-containing protein n=1 Tax=Actinoplanes nipponensis TaxID=135950 RepID=A0A919JFI2_9ACTN|nr:DUF4037 domain-containing protein [Actinoplanes nipponensis]GIE48587.1 hypothetical protein Ani05nite_21210 [Actinoplanes nipponensis]